jgi:hypothetical protein
MDFSASDASHVIAWMLAGLKNWEQGMLGEAGKFFSAVAGAEISPDEEWLAIYQSFARDYLADQELLSAPVFEKLPEEVAGCEAAVAELNGILEKLKTRGRARFNVRAWQLDLAKHSKLLAAPKVADPGPVTPALPAWDPAVGMVRLEELSKECRFADAAAYLKSFSADSTDETWTAMLSLTEAATVFLADLEADLAKQPVTDGILMKSEETVRSISCDAAGSITITDGTGRSRPATWADFPASALIDLHRILVKNMMTEMERLRRHECAISFNWLAGDREQAIAAAAALSQVSSIFKQRWDSIASGLPK